jgi:hypothetical protein
MMGTSAGTLLASYLVQDEAEKPVERVVVLAESSEILHILADLPRTGMIQLRSAATNSRTRGFMDGYVAGATRGVPRLAVREPDGAYVSSSSEYEILGTDLQGSPEWALRVDWPRVNFPETEIDAFLDALRRVMPDASRADIAVPAHLPAIDELRVDGRGRLFVFPSVASVASDEGKLAGRPVDVYSSDGDLIWAATWRGVAPTQWKAAFEDYIYTIETDTATEEQVIVQYELVASDDRRREQQ